MSAPSIMFLIVYIMFIFLWSFFTVGISVATYVFRALGMMGMMKSFGMKNPWTAFIPVYNSWLFGKVAEESSGRLNGKKSLPFGKIMLAGKIIPIAMTVLYLVVWCLMAIIMGIVGTAEKTGGTGVSEAFAVVFTIVFFIIWFATMIANLIAIAIRVFECIAAYKVFSCFDPEHAVLFTVLSAVINVTMPFFLFAIRNKEPAPPFIAPDAFEPEN